MMWQKRGDKRGRWRGLAGCLVLCASLGSPLLASDFSCSIRQVSRTTERQLGARAVGLSENGRQALILTYAFAGTVPVLTSPELFRVDLQSNQWNQLTQTPDGTFTGEISADGRLERIVFVSNQNLVEENPEGVQQLYLLNSGDQSIHQLTHFSGTQTRILSPTVSGNGSIAAFLANVNPAGSNRDLSREVFVVDLENRDLSQISVLSQVSLPSDPSLNFNGDRLVYMVNHTLSGFSEIDFVDLVSRHNRLVYTAPRLASPTLTSDGKAIFFVTDIDPVGSNLDRSLEIFRITVDQSGEFGGVADQLSSFPRIDGGSFDNLAISGDGQHLVFRSGLDLADWTGDGADNLYLFDISSSRLEQLTRLRGFHEPANRLFTDRHGERVLFSSRADLTGQNSDGNLETFTAGCQASDVFFFPQIGDGQAGEIRFRTSFVMANTGTDTTVRIDFFSSLGQPLPIDVVGFGRTESLEVNVRQGTPLILETLGRQDLRVGFARVRTSPGISASAVFTGSLVSSGTTLYEAAVPMTTLLSEFSVVVNTRGNYQTGLAVANPGAENNAFAPLAGGDAEMRIRLYDHDFNLLAERVEILPQGRHRSQFVEQLFHDVPGVREMVGLLTVQSSRPLAVLTLRMKDDPNVDFPLDIPNLTTLPVAPGIPDAARVAKSGTHP